MGLNRILVVDDEEPIGDVLYQGLSKFGYRVTVVKNAEEALTIPISCKKSVCKNVIKD